MTFDNTHDWMGTSEKLIFPDHAHGTTRVVVDSAAAHHNSSRFPERTPERTDDPTEAGGQSSRTNVLKTNVLKTNVLKFVSRLDSVWWGKGYALDGACWLVVASLGTSLQRDLISA